MNYREEQFLAESRKNTSDLELRRKMNFSLKQSDDAYKNGKNQFANLQLTRGNAKNTKWKAIENLDKYLLEFEAKFTAKGGNVIWAENAEQALTAVLAVCKAKEARLVVKSKSMVTEEIQLNRFLSDQDIEVVETDLGEYIQQLDGEPPYHIVAPAMHKSKEDVARLFHEKLQVKSNLTPEELTLVARTQLRQKFRDADIGITGVNYLLADIGGIAVTENEGNAWLSSSFPKTHIAITGIEKLLPSINDLDLFWPLLATHGSGQRVTTYNSIFTGPRQEGEVDGPSEMYVILLDNGRTNIIADTTARESLYCIRCGACLNVCPVYKNVGGHAYNATYSGPIGSVITPYLLGFAENKHLSYASTLCGSCTEICPVGIKLHELLLYNRRKSVEQKNESVTAKAAWYFWKQINLRRWIIDLTSGRLKNMFISKVFRRQWGEKRKLPRFAPYSFNQMWRRRKRG